MSSAVETNQTLLTPALCSLGNEDVLCKTGVIIVSPINAGHTVGMCP